MKRINARLLIIVGVAIVVLAMGVHVVHGIQVNRSLVVSLKKSAEQSRENGDLGKSVLFYQQYLRYMPDDAERAADYALVTAKIAQLTTARQDSRVAMRELEKALLNDKRGGASRLNDKTRIEVQRALVDLQMAGGYYAAARALLLDLKAVGTAEPNDDLRLAKCHVAIVHYPEAVQLLLSTIGYDPESKSFNSEKAPLKNQNEPYTLLAVLLREQMSDSEAEGLKIDDRKATADRVMDQLVTANKDSAEAWLAKARYLQQYYTREKAKPSIEQALALSPDDVNVLLQASEMALQAKEFANAEELLKKGIAAHPKEDRLHFAFAFAAYLQNHLDDMKQRLEQGLQELPTSERLLQKLFDLQFQQRDVSSARVTLEKIAAAKRNPELREFREAQLLALDGKPLEATRRLELVRPQLVERWPDYARQADTMLMQCYQILGQPDMSAVVARRALSTNRGAIDAQMALANSLQSLGKTAEARAEFEKLMVTLQERNDQPALLAQVCRSLVELRLIEQMQRPADARDWNSVESYIRAQHEIIKEPTASLLLADVSSRKGQPEEARKIVGELVKSYPDSSLVYAALVGIELQQHDAEAALRLLDSAPEKLCRELPLRVQRIEAILLRSGTSRESVVKALEEVAANADTLSDNERARLYSALAMGYQRLSDRDKALEFWNKSADLQPHDSRIHWMLFDMVRPTPDLKSLSNLAVWFEHEFGPDSAQAKLTRAAVLSAGVREEQRPKLAAQKPQFDLTDANTKDLQRARDLLREVETLRPDWYERPKILAEIDVLEGKVDYAIKDLQEALQEGPADSFLVAQLAKLLFLSHRNAEAEEIFKTYASSLPPELRRLEISNLIQTGDLPESLRKFEELMPEDSQNPTEHLAYAQLLEANGKIEEAEKHFRQATKLGSRQPETWLALVNFLVRAGKGEDARKAVQEAQIALPEDRRALALAQGYDAIGDADLAEQYYKIALDAAPSDLRLKQLVAAFYIKTNHAELAKPHLNALLDLKPSDADQREVQAWARRASAQVLASDGSYPSLQRALKEYLKPAPGERLAPADLQVKANLLAARFEPSAVREALDTLNDLKQQRALSNDERLMVAQMYERIGDWSSARDEMQNLVSQSNASPATYITFIEMLLRRSAADEAQTWLTKLQAMPRVNQRALATLTARVKAAQGKGDQAAKYLLAMLPSEKPMPKDKVELMPLIAELLEQIGQPDQAEKLWRQYVEYNPQRSLLLAAFLARRGKVDEALNIAEQVRKSESTLSVLQVIAIAGRQRLHPLTQPQAQRIEQWFTRALRDDPDSTSLQIIWADFLDSQGRYDEMEKVYRSILSRSDVPAKDRALVANNLAFVLAIQGRQLDEAKKLTDETVAYLGPISDTLDTRGMVSLAKGDTKQAIRDLTEAVAILAPQPAKYVHLALAQAAANDMSSARDSIDKAKELKLNPDDLSPADRKKYDALLNQLGKS
jgi:cellulose synthase operon protein C